MNTTELVIGYFNKNHSYEEVLYYYVDNSKLFIVYSDNGYDRTYEVDLLDYITWVFNKAKE